MSENKRCFLDHNRPCDLTCKAAFEVDDPVDNIDCHFVWLSYHFGEALFEVKQVLENLRGFAGPGGGPKFPGGGFKFPGGGTKGPGGGPKGPKSPSEN